MAAEPALQAGLGGATADHLISIDTVHWPLDQDTGSAKRRPEEGGFAVVPDPGGVEIFVEKLLDLVVHRHLVALAAFLMQTQHQRFPFAK